MSEDKTLEDLSEEQISRGVAAMVVSIMSSVIKQVEDSSISMPDGMLMVAVDVAKLHMFKTSRKRPLTKFHMPNLGFELAVASFLALLEASNQALEEVGGRKAMELLEKKLRVLARLGPDTEEKTDG